MRHPVMFLCAALAGLLVGCASAPVANESPVEAKAPDFRDVVAAATNRVFPAVVYVKCLREDREQGESKTYEVSGSGVIISDTGEAVTNWHVVDKAVEIRCLLADGRAYVAKTLGTDKDTDLALIQFQELQGVPGSARLAAEKELPIPYADLGDSDLLKEGDFVMAMGAPWGLNRSVSIGIVSCIKRYLEETSEYSHWIQTDAAISPGNSGGPLVNTAGEVVGINSRGYMWGGDMAFAVPSKTVQRVVSDLRLHGKVDWSWTGLTLQPLRDFDRNMFFKGDRGVIIASTDPESPARRAGLQPKDRIVSINSVELTAETTDDLPAIRRFLGLLPRNEPAAFRVVRGEETLDVTLEPREKGEVEGAELDCPRWDFTVKEINQFDNENLYFYRKKGVFIYGVKYPGNASNSGLNVQDIILKIGGEDVSSLADVERIHKQRIDNIDSETRVVFTLLRNGLMIQKVLDYARDYERE